MGIAINELVRTGFCSRASKLRLMPAVLVRKEIKRTVALSVIVGVEN